jgi:arginine dihydrolase
MKAHPAPRILMCPPDYFGIEYEINPWMNIRVGSDAERSRDQWAALVETLRELGVTVE